MIIKNYEYCGYTIELHEHPIYHDFEFVVKLNGIVKGASNHVYQNGYDAEMGAQILINEL